MRRQAWGLYGMDRAIASAAPAGGVEGRPRAGEEGAAGRFALCETLLRSGHPSASDVLGQCLAEFPGYAEGWCLLGAALVDLRQIGAAVVCFDRARRVSTTAEVALHIGLALRSAGRTAEARAAFADAVLRDPASVRARFLLGVAAQDAGDFSAAAAAYDAALALDPGLGEAALNLGTVRQAMADLDGARAAYGRAAALRPDGFARAAQALATGSTGELWLDLGALRRALG